MSKRIHTTFLIKEWNWWMRLIDAVKMPMREMASIWRRKIHIYINNNSPFNPNKRFHSNWASAGWVNKITTQRNRDETEHSIYDDRSGLDQKSCLFFHIVWVFSSISVSWFCDSMNFNRNVFDEHWASLTIRLSAHEWSHLLLAD